VGSLHARQVVNGVLDEPNEKNTDLSTRLAHWLGRPSHINSLQFNVLPLTAADFAEQMQESADANLRLSTEAFVRLSKLTIVLSSVLDSFYLVHRNPRTMSPNEALSRAGECQSKLRECLSEEGSVLLQPSRVINGGLKRTGATQKLPLI
jgi:hypothetical protein